MHAWALQIHGPLLWCRDALRIVKRDGLPTNYKFDMKILKRSDRDKLDAKPCPECQAVSQLAKEFCR